MGGARDEGDGGVKGAAPESAWGLMWAIAHSTSGPPRPPGLSPTLTDFLDQCFKTNPRDRPEAVQLLQHPWIAVGGDS